MAPWPNPAWTLWIWISHSTHSVGTMRRKRMVLSRLLPPAFIPRALPIPEGTWSAKMASMPESIGAPSLGRIHSTSRPSSLIPSSLSGLVKP